MSKVWFVTGSSRGLGRALVEAALDAGARVAATARNPGELHDVLDKYVVHAITSSLRFEFQAADGSRRAS